MASSGQDDIGAASVSAVEAAASAGDEDGATGEGNNNNNNTTTGTTATTMASTTWAQAREASTHMVLQSALEDLETRASKHQEELIRTREKAASAERAHLASQAKVEDLQRTLLEKTEALEKLRLVYEAESAKTSLQKESYTALEERMDRLQIESDSLREEIRYVFVCVSM
jgi:chromosome segregation ATPase